MPIISRFHGIVITMYWSNHAPPRFHDLKPVQPLE